MLKHAAIRAFIHKHTYTFAAGDRYEPKAGVCSLICLMSRYCNDFASDLRLFIYSPAVLADRRLDNRGLSLVILTVLNSRLASASQPLFSVLRRGEMPREFRERVTYEEVIYHRRIAAGDRTSTSGNPREFLVPLKNRSFDK